MIQVLGSAYRQLGAFPGRSGENVEPFEGGNGISHSSSETGDVVLATLAIPAQAVVTGGVTVSLDPSNP